MGGYADPVQIESNSGVSVAVDSSGRVTVLNTDPAAKAIGAATYFGVSCYTAALTSGNTAHMMLCPPNTTTRCHAVIGICTSGAGRFEIWEDATALLGSALTVGNADRNSATAAAMTAYGNPTSIELTLATRMAQRPLSATNEYWIWTGSRPGTEVILKQGKNYMAYFEASAAGSVALEAQWYEV